MQKGKNAARKTAAKKRHRTPWNSSELLFTVFGYLTMRQVPLILSSKHGAAPVADLINEIIKANGLPEAKMTNRTPKLNVTKNMETLTNVPASAQINPNTEAAGNAKLEIMKPDEVGAKIYGMLAGNLDLPEQNKVIAGLLQRMASDRKKFIEMYHSNAKELEERIQAAHKINEEFLNIVRNS